MKTVICKKCKMTWSLEELLAEDITFDRIGNLDTWKCSDCGYKNIMRERARPFRLQRYYGFFCLTCKTFMVYCSNCGTYLCECTGMKGGYDDIYFCPSCDARMENERSERRKERK